MEISKQIGRLQPGAEADDLRKAIGKKKRDLMATMEAKFIEGAHRLRHRPRGLPDLWSLMTAAADYSFNKSHAACYALISYRTAYLKANYPAEYMAAVISSVMSTKDKVPFFVNRCEEMGIEVLPPDVNDLRPRVRRLRQQHPLRPRRGQERRPLGGRGDSQGARGATVRFALGLLRAGRRPGGQQAGDGVPDQVRRPRLDRRRRARRCSRRSRRRSPPDRSRRRTPQRGQASIFALDDGAATGGIRSQHPPILGEEFEQRELLAMEKETMGTFLSDHPLSQVREALRVRADCTLAELEKKPDGAQVTVGGIVAEAKKIRTKTGANMMFATLDDLEGRVEMIIFAKTLRSNEGLIDTDAVLLVRGRVDRKDRGEIKLVVFDAETFEPTSDEVETAKEEVRKLAEPDPLPAATRRRRATTLRSSRSSSRCSPTSPARPRSCSR